MGESQHALIDERVMHHDVSLGEAGKRMQREQAGIAGSCAREPNMPRLEPGEPSHGAAQAVDHAGAPSR